jgi:DNA-binding Lrp family transcriptional regulator
MSESALVRRIIKAVKARYPRAYVIKIADRFRRGVPDLHITFPRNFTWEPGREEINDEVYVETKAPKGGLSKIQQAEHKKIEEALGTVLVAYCVEDVLKFLETNDAVP